MNELESILHAYDYTLRGRRTALATVVAVSGSSYRRPGARMLICETGETVGSVSGGCLEADVAVRAQCAIQTGHSDVQTYEMSDIGDDPFGPAMGCDGVITIVIEPTGGRSADCIETLRQVVAGRGRAVLATAYGQGEPSRLLLPDDGDPSGDTSLMALARAALDARMSTNVTVAARQVFVEYLRPAQELIVFGAGPDAAPLVAVAKAVGWRAKVVDHRTSYASADRFPDADSVIVSRAEEIAERIAVSDETAAVIATHNYPLDRALLYNLLKTPAAYIGVIGSRARTARLIADLREDGVTMADADLKRLHGPAGLDIGPMDPQSVALSVVAEIQAWRAGREGGLLRDSHRAIQPHDQLEPGEAGTCPSA